METRNVKMTLETAKRWKEMGGEYEQVAVETFPELAKNGNEWDSKILGSQIKGVYIDTYSNISETDITCFKADRNTFKTEKQAKSALAYAQLTQLMALPEYNGDWVADWTDSSQNQWCIVLLGSEMIVQGYRRFKQHICFKTLKIAETFLSNNRDLLKQYFEL